MSQPINDGGPAFPEIRIKQIGDPYYQAPTRVYYQGMCLRDYFAGQALVGLVEKNSLWTAELFASNAYALADAMISFRNSTQKK